MSGLPSFWLLLSLQIYVIYYFKIFFLFVASQHSRQRLLRLLAHGSREYVGGANLNVLEFSILRRECDKNKPLICDFKVLFTNKCALRSRLISRSPDRIHFEGVSARHGFTDLRV